MIRIPLRVLAQMERDMKEKEVPKEIDLELSQEDWNILIRYVMSTTNLIGLIQKTVAAGKSQVPVKNPIVTQVLQNYEAIPPLLWAKWGAEAFEINKTKTESDS